MTKQFTKEIGISITDAINNLSNIVEVDHQLDEKDFKQGIKTQLLSLKSLKKNEKESTLKTIKKTFKSVHNYLEHVYHKDKKHFEDIEIQRGIKAIMLLANEAAEKLEKCTSLFKHSYKEGKIQEIQEYKDLRKFYVNKILRRLKKVLEKEQKWTEEWQIEEPQFNIEKIGLKDLEMVKKDQDYELFYIRKDDGTPFFNRNLLRHIKLVNDFDQMVAYQKKEDPLLHIQILLDRQFQKIAKEMRLQLNETIQNYYAHAFNYLDLPFIQKVNKSILSLFLASNPSNLIEKSMTKSCFLYFHDFQIYLREILASKDYKKLIAHSHKVLDQLSRILVSFIQECCFAFFTQEKHLSDFIQFFSSLIKSKKKIFSSDKENPVTFWNDLLDFHEALEEVLKNYPSGPLFKTLDIFSKRGEQEGFDPLFQNNQPNALFTLSNQRFEAKCLRLPSPSFHKNINKASIVDEFKEYLHHLKYQKEPKTHLLFNLQDRTSWKEHARCHALEKLSRNPKHLSQIILVTLPKQGDFYFQQSNYQEISNAKTFIKMFKEQINLEENSGYFFSKTISKREIKTFINKILLLIHKKVFENQKELTRLNRLDFIEIFYQFLILKVIDLTQPSFFSFTCKDGIDLGGIASFGLYSMIKIISSQPYYKQKEQQALCFMLFEPSLMLRGRLIHQEPLGRTMNAMTTFHEAYQKNKKEFKQEFKALFQNFFFQKINVQF